MRREAPGESPFRDLIDGPVDVIHSKRLDQDRYGLLRKLHGEGFTEYLAFIDPVRRSATLSLATRAGFREGQVEDILSVRPALFAALEHKKSDHVLRSLLNVYLGEDAARRVLAGQVLRGTGEEFSCAIWFCDMRGFTELSDRSSARDVVALLDGVFERIGAAESRVYAAAAWPGVIRARSSARS